MITASAAMWRLLPPPLRPAHSSTPSGGSAAISMRPAFAKKGARARARCVDSHRTARLTPHRSTAAAAPPGSSSDAPHVRDVQPNADEPHPSAASDHRVVRPASTRAATSAGKCVMTLSRGLGSCACGCHSNNRPFGARSHPVPQVSQVVASPSCSNRNRDSVLSTDAPRVCTPTTKSRRPAR